MCIRDSDYTAGPDETALRGYKFYWHKSEVVGRAEIAEPVERLQQLSKDKEKEKAGFKLRDSQYTQFRPCLLYTSDAADERSSVDLGGRRIIKKKKQRKKHRTNHGRT